MRLNIHMFRLEQFFRPLYRYLFGDINFAAAPVISCPGYPSAYLLVIAEETASITALETKFSLAISSIPSSSFLFPQEPPQISQDRSHTGISSLLP
jgi:hypothetical protein